MTKDRLAALVAVSFIYISISGDSLYCILLVFWGMLELLRDEVRCEVVTVGNVTV